MKSTFAVMLDREACIQWAQNKTRGTPLKPNITDTTWHLHQHTNHHSTLIYTDKCTFMYIHVHKTMSKTEFKIITL